MRALDRKLLRDLLRLKGQMASIALVVASGVMTVVTMRGTYQSLQSALDSYYRDYHLADLWSDLKRAPESVRYRIEAVPGVMAAETRVSFNATLDLPGLDAPAMGKFVSIPERRERALNDIHLTSGRYVAPGGADEAIISRKFAVANTLVPGDSLRALINGTLRTLRIVGIGISPEHGYSVPPGSLFPDDKRFGVIWMSRRELGPAYDMNGAFNEIAVKLSPQANAALVKVRMDRVLEPYGGIGTYGRDQQMSVKSISDEVASISVMGTMIPAVFLAVAAFLLHLVMGRLIATERTEIAVLKAFGYSNRQVGTHYLQFALVAVFAGAIAGTMLGVWLGHEMLALYRTYFEFPVLVYQMSWGLVMIGVGVSAAAATIGAIGAVRNAVNLPPAEAMRAAPPARFEPGFLERSGLGNILPITGRMILRNVERQIGKTILSAAGVSFSVAILVIGMFMYDGVALMMDLQFRLGQREDVALTFNQPLTPDVKFSLAQLGGVRRTELFRSLPVRLRAEHRHRDVAITGLPARGKLRQIVTASGGIQPLPPNGLVLSAMLAEELRVTPGDTLAVKVLEGSRHAAFVTVTGVVDDFIGLSAYMQLDALQRMAGDAAVVSGAFLSVDKLARPALMSRFKRLPKVASVASPAQMHAAFEKQMADTLFVSVGFLVFFSAVIAVAVIYNGARIALSERGRELASLRVLGFTRREVAVILLGEQAVITLVAIPAGWFLGYLLAGAVVAGMRSEIYRIPLVINSSTYFWSTLITLGAAAASGLLVRRRLNNLDLIEVLKTRE